MLVVNAATVPGVSVWSETVILSQGTQYNFSLWGVSSYPVSPATLDVQFDGTSLSGTPFNLTSSSAWQQFTSTWSPIATGAVTVTIYDTNLAGSGNDFALDDISLTVATPEPTSLVLFGCGALGMMGYAWRRRKQAACH